MQEPTATLEPFPIMVVTPGNCTNRSEQESDPKLSLWMNDREKAALADSLLQQGVQRVCDMSCGMFLYYNPSHLAGVLPQLSGSLFAEEQSSHPQRAVNPRTQEQSCETIMHRPYQTRTLVYR